MSDCAAIGNLRRRDCEARPTCGDADRIDVTSGLPRVVEIHNYLLLF